MPFTSYILIHQHNRGANAYAFQCDRKLKILTPSIQNKLIEIFKIDFNPKASMTEYLELKEVTTIPTINF